MHVMPMDVCHILLGRPWKHERGAMHDGKNNTYKFSKDGVNHTLLPMEEEDASRKYDPKNLLLSGKEYLQQMEEYEVSISLVCKPKVIITSTKVSNLPLKFKRCRMVIVISLYMIFLMSYHPLEKSVIT